MSQILKALEEDDFLKLKQAIKAGENLNQMVTVGIDDDEEMVLLFYALRQRVSCDSIRLLIENGADVHYINEDGVSVFDEAAIVGDIEILSYLADEIGLEISTTKRKSGFTPFMQACCYGKMDIAKFLIERGVDIWAKDNNGMDALEYTRRLRQVKMQEFIESLKENQ